ncbi:hypothetical protein TH0011_11430 [Helicobacter pylori]
MVYAMRKVIEPVYESKDDYEIFRQLALRIGGNETEQNSLNLRVTWNGLRTFMKKAMALL